MKQMELGKLFSEYAGKDDRFAAAVGAMLCTHVEFSNIVNGLSEISMESIGKLGKKVIATDALFGALAMVYPDFRTRMEAIIGEPSSVEPSESSEPVELTEADAAAAAVEEASKAAVYSDPRSASLRSIQEKLSASGYKCTSMDPKTLPPFTMHVAAQGICRRMETGEIGESIFCLVNPPLAETWPVVVLTEGRGYTTLTIAKGLRPIEEGDPLQHRVDVGDFKGMSSQNLCETLGYTLDYSSIRECLESINAVH